VLRLCFCSPKDCKIYLVGTKLDIVSNGSKERAVDMNVVTQYSDGIQAQHIETSSKTGENVGE